MIKAFHVLALVFRVRANHTECRCRSLRRDDAASDRRSLDYRSRVCSGHRHSCTRLWMQLRMRLRALRLNGFRRSPKMPLRPALFLQLHFFAENIFVLRVGLRQIVESKALPEFQLAAAFAIALDHQLDTPF